MAPRRLSCGEAHGWISHPPRTTGVILAPPYKLNHPASRRKNPPPTARQTNNRGIEILQRLDHPPCDDSCFHVPGTRVRGHTDDLSGYTTRAHQCLTTLHTLRAYRYGPIGVRGPLLWPSHSTCSCLWERPILGGRRISTKNASGRIGHILARICTCR